MIYFFHIMFYWWLHSDILITYKNKGIFHSFRIIGRIGQTHQSYAIVYNFTTRLCWLQKVGLFLTKLIGRFARMVWIESFGTLVGIIGTCVVSIWIVWIWRLDGRIGLKIACPTFHWMISSPRVGLVSSTGSYSKGLRTLRTLEFSLKLAKNKFRLHWTIAGYFELFQKRLKKARPIWTCLNQFGQIWTSLDQFEQV